MFEKCPVCGLFMDEARTWHDGQPVIEYTCPMHGPFYKDASAGLTEWIKSGGGKVTFSFMQEGGDESLQSQQTS